LSSAILYGAIVVIWAGVLIPRWLRRESSSEETTPVSPDVPAATPAEPQPESARREEQRSRNDQRSHEQGPRDERRPSPDSDQERARVIGARRRLLGMLLALAIGSGALAIMQLAAWWVVLPPSVMLAGYLALLREASRADAERRSAQPARPVQAPAAPPVPVVPVPVASDAEIIDITGRVGDEFYDQYVDAKLRAVGD
jgi:hypothetical protein